MCLIFLALNHHPKYRLVVAANRDEFYERKTAPARFWNDHPNILGGRDLEASGTWLGVTTNGRIAMVTNFRDPRNIRTQAPSRGKLVTDFLLSTEPVDEYMKALQLRAKEYNGFSLIAGTVHSLSYISNYNNGVIALNSGLFGLSNHLLETPWPKVQRGKDRIQQLLKRDELNPDDFFDVLSDETVHSDEFLPDTGVGIELERRLSAAFIRSPGYGTRSSTVILADYDGHIYFNERVFDPISSTFSFNKFEFDVER